jgi:hypothetical protein
MGIHHKLLAVGVALLAISCGGGAAGSPGGGGDDLSVSIEGPSQGADVQVPFTVNLSASVPLGPTDTGEHHVHLYYDSDAQGENYDVVESDSFKVTKLPPGTHTILASLRNADHSPAGAEDETTVKVVASQDVKEGTTENDEGGRGY